MEKKKQLYIVHSNNDIGTRNRMDIFEDELVAYHFMIDDMEKVIDVLNKNGYKPQSAENDTSCEVWVPDTLISYQWEISEVTYHNK